MYSISDKKIVFNRKSAFSAALAFVVFATQFLGVYAEAYASPLNQCPVIAETFFSSGTDTKLQDGTSAVATYNEHPFWTANIPGATWVWSSYYVEDPLVVTAKTFVKTFEVSNTASVESATITMAADNTYRVFVNNVLVAEDLTEFNYYTEKTFDLKSYVSSGVNTVRFEITNITNPLAQTKESNPAGLLYRIDLSTKESNCGENPANNPPIITLIGANPLRLDTGTTFVDPGATANDAEDGDITANIVKTGTVNTSTVGTYTINYSVTDSGGLSASTTRQVIVSDPYVPPVVNQCTIDFYSEPSDQVEGGGMAFATYKNHPDWTVSIPGATWIWSSYLVENSLVDDTKIFEKRFNIATTSTVNSAILTMAADNSYTVSVNGIQVGADATEFNYKEESKDIYNVTSYINNSANRISFTVKNWGVASSTPQTNPAGLLYKLSVTVSGIGENCDGPQPVNTPPEITLIGNNPINIFVGDNFSDPGATALDREDGDITANIVKTGTVNTSTVGTYTINYSVTDSGGLSDYESRSVVVSPRGGGGSPKPTVSLVANPGSIILGATSTLSWTSGNANSCSASWTVSTSTSGSQAVSPATTTDYAITCVGNGGSATATTTVIVTEGSNGGPRCTLELVSDTNTTVEGGVKSVATYKDHPYWTANIPGATWIWKTFFTSTPTQQEVYTFERIFNINSEVESATLVVAADNSYVLYVNGLKIGEDAGEFNYRDEQKDTFDLKNVLQPGINKIEFSVKNWGVADSDSQTNPAGLLYKLTVVEKGENCDGSTPTPSVTLNANPSSIIKGATSTLSWVASNVTFCSAPWTNATSTSGSQEVSPATTTNYQISCGGTYGTTTATTTVTVNADNGGGTLTPSINLNANPATINPGATSTLSWNSSNTNYCSAPWTLSTSTSGTQEVSPSATTEYSIACGGIYGTTTATTTVTVNTDNGGGGSNNPTVSLSADPGTIIVGGSSTLTWTSNNTNSCAASWTSATSTSGSQVVNPGSTTEYSISCTGNNGTASATTTVIVNTNNGGGGNGGGGGGGGGGIGGRRRDISNLLAPQGEVLGATSCAYLRDYLRRDWKNDPIEVLKLQSFLNVFEKESLSYTSVFDEPTYQAVSRFQNKYFYDILEPWGHDAPTGFVYILTKKKINEIYCNTLISLTPDQKQEILSFRSFIESLKSRGGLGSSSFDSQVLSSKNVLENNATNTGIVVVNLGTPNKGGGEENRDSSVVKNAAISLFGVGQSVANNKNYLVVVALLLLILGLGLLVRKLLMESEDPDAMNKSISSDFENNSVSGKNESPVIVLPGAASSEDELPEEEIVIEDEEEKRV